MTLRQDTCEAPIVPRNAPGAGFGRDYLESRIIGEFPIAKHLGICVESAGDHAVVLRAPLPANANDKGTAFGGSLYSVAVLAGWGWVTCHLAARDRDCEVVIQESTMRFLAPCEGELHARAIAPSEADLDRLFKMLKRAGRGRVPVRVEVGRPHALVASFEGIFAAAKR
ncbi:MAG TPA: YiiD C-terminal domain-containing protein [Steroidobacteraceae bacterium]|jgi:thioesterase domain-containing protein|nr:YiiD C-terminal domain-containing protein [Steroidobacteraceae bacterium]